MNLRDNYGKLKEGKNAILFAQKVTGQRQKSTGTNCAKNWLGLLLCLFVF